MTDTDKGQVPQVDPLEGITEEDILGSQEQSAEQEQSESPISSEMASRLKAAKINVDKLPSAIQGNKELLEEFVSSIEARQKDFQAQWTRKNQELSDKANAFDALAANPDFNEWVDNYKKAGNTAGGTNVESKISFDNAPAHLKGEALLDWYIDRKLEERGLANIPGELSAMKSFLTQTQIQSLRDRIPDFKDNEEAVAKIMQETGIRDPVRAYRLVKAETGPTEEQVKEHIKQELLADIRKNKEEAGGIVRGSSRSNTVERPIVDKDIRGADKDKVWEDIVNSVMEGSPDEV